MRNNLENNDYPDIYIIYKQKNITSDEDYNEIIPIEIKRPRIFLIMIKCYLIEKWHNTFNPLVLNTVKSNMSIQFIIDKYSCAYYVFEYVNNTN